MPQIGLLTGDINLIGAFTSTTLNVPSNTITNAMVNSAAAIAASKLVHQYAKTYAQANAAAADETRVIHSCTMAGGGTILNFEAGSIAAAVGDSTCTVDLKKDGTTCLSAPITLDSGNAAYTPEAGTLTVTTFAQTDVLTIVIDATIGTGTLPTGVYCTCNFTEAAA